MTRLLLLSLALLLSGCASGQGKPKLPFDAWFVGLLAPNYMEVWIESVDVIDRRGLAYEQVYQGISAIQTPRNNQGKPAGWPKRVGGGAGKNLPGIDLPEIIFVRWQSLVEPQTYNVRINIPGWVREEMLKPARAYCNWDGKWIDGLYRKNIAIGLAPGGIAKAWVLGPCLEPIEIGRFEGVISKVGPDLGRSNGQYALPLTPESKAYIETHGVPYGSW
ncbi:DUF2931 family protein [Pseudomonas sp. SJZ079]|uniref:DUF2931 family protein n=1 Tax=Pseudomonas sp. SJZ079 TaxID=2572887 RepID=UPI00119AF3AD|nr:DUF2931 family protein [Pseudomonas sp. SJZ079]TWC37705.1 DUF2931 family protein [Pseudomonas sp. SJZ079]